LDSLWQESWHSDVYLLAKTERETVGPPSEHDTCIHGKGRIQSPTPALRPDVQTKGSLGRSTDGGSAPCLTMPAGRILGHVGAPGERDRASQRTHRCRIGAMRRTRCRCLCEPPENLHLWRYVGAVIPSMITGGWLPSRCAAGPWSEVAGVGCQE